MITKVRNTAIAVALAGGMALAGSAPASAAHCADDGRPGNQGYAAHVQGSNGSSAHNEGDHQGYSQCNERSANYVE